MIDFLLLLRIQESRFAVGDIIFFFCTADSLCSGTILPLPDDCLRKQKLDTRNVARNSYYQKTSIRGHRHQDRHSKCLLVFALNKSPFLLRFFPICYNFTHHASFCSLTDYTNETCITNAHNVFELYLQTSFNQLLMIFSNLNLVANKSIYIMVRLRKFVQ